MKSDERAPPAAPVKGQKYGRWECTGRMERHTYDSHRFMRPIIQGVYRYECVCSCGRVKFVNAYSLIKGLSRGCAECRGARAEIMAMFNQRKSI